jgi:SsrA-binding protein
MTIFASNRKASFLYTFLQTYEVGLVLKGPEVKSIRSGGANLTDCYGLYEKKEVFLHGLLVSRWKGDNEPTYQETRPKKALLKKRELRQISKEFHQKGLTLVLTKLYLNERGKIKGTLVLAKGKKAYDKREKTRKREQEREMAAAIKKTFRQG